MRGLASVRLSFWLTIESVESLWRSLLKIFMRKPLPPTLDVIIHAIATILRSFRNDSAHKENNNLWYVYRSWVQNANMLGCEGIFQFIEIDVRMVSLHAQFAKRSTENVCYKKVEHTVIMPIIISMAPLLLKLIGYVILFLS